MQSFQTRNFGRISYEAQATIEFPCGLPGFEDRRRFLALDFDNSKPLVFLQSLEDPALCFVTAPVQAIEPAYVLRMTEEDIRHLGFDGAHQPRIGADVICLAVISLEESGTTANLLAPVVINLRSLKAVQAIAQQPGYSHRFPLAPQEAAVCS